MIANHKKLEILEKVLSSEEFSHSKQNRELLKYLVDASLDNKVLDEMTIANEFFCKDNNFNPLEDASVRVYLSQIRKRLSNYYLTEGKNDKIQIDIPKGRYEVRFCKKNEIYSRAKKIRLTKTILPVFTLLLLSIVIVLWIRYDRLIKKVEIFPKNNPIWAEYLADKKPALVVLGDYFFMYIDRDGDNPRFNVRDPRINSIEDFQEYNKRHPDGIYKLKPLRHTYLRPSAVWGFLELFSILRSIKSSFFIRQASEIDWEDISSHNIIFIGTFKQMYLLKTFLGKMNIDFSIYPNILYLNNKDGEQVQKFESILIDETRQYDDVGLIAKIKGPNNNTIIFITGFHEGSVISGSKAISDPDFPKELLKNHGNKFQSPLHFRCVLKVEGFSMTELNSKIEYFDILSP